MSVDEASWREQLVTDPTSASWSSTGARSGARQQVAPMQAASSFSHSSCRQPKSPPQKGTAVKAQFRN